MTGEAPPFTVVKKGYDPTEVDNRVVQLDAALVKSRQRCKELERDLDTAMATAEHLEGQLAERTAALGQARELEDALRLTYLEATRDKNQLLADARNQAERIVAEARDEAEQSTQSTRQEWQKLLDERRAELTDAEHQARLIEARQRERHADYEAALRDAYQSTVNRVQQLQSAFEAFTTHFAALTSTTTDSLGELAHYFRNVPPLPAPEDVPGVDESADALVNDVPDPEPAAIEGADITVDDDSEDDAAAAPKEALDEATDNRRRPRETIYDRRSGGLPEIGEAARDTSRISALFRSS